MDGKGMKGILVTASAGGAAVTDAGGNYTIWPLDAGTYYVAPFGGSYQFVPPSQVVTLPPDATGVDFIAFSGGPMIANSPLGGIVCIKYSFPMSASGGLAPYTWSASGLPPGLSINPQTGVISGTPIQDGGYNVTITVKDAAGCTDTKTFKMNIKPNKPFIPAGALPRGKVCLPYSAALQVTGGCQPYTWMITGGALPPGLAMDDSGVIRGEPKEAGVFTFSVRVADQYYQLAYQTFTIVVDPNPPVILTTALPAANLCAKSQQYLYQLQATGGRPPYTWALVAGQLPDGLALDPSGLIYGRPRKKGTFTFTVEVTDDCKQKTRQTLTIVVSTPPEITTPSNLPDAKTHDQYRQQIQIDPPGSYLWSLIEGGQLASLPQPNFRLPRGVVFDTQNGVLLSSSISECGWFQFALKAADQYGASDTQWFELKVGCDIPIITTTSLPAATEGEPYSAELTAEGGRLPYTWKVTNLPPEMNAESAGKKLILHWYASELPVDTDGDTFNIDNPIYNDNGIVRINATVWGADADTIRTADSDSIPSDTQEFTITVRTPRLAITTPSFVQCKYNQSCDIPFLTTGGGASTVTLLTDEGNLPPGLEFDGEGLSGTPMEAGLWEVTFEVDDGQSNYQQGSIQIQVLPDPPFGIKTPLLPNGHVGDFYVQPLENDGGNGPYTWSLVPHPGFDLPPGLFLDPSGTISGMPMTGGKFDILVQAQDATPVDWGTPLTATRKLVLTIKECSSGTGPGALSKTDAHPPAKERP
jgi:hypothetical protein